MYFLFQHDKGHFVIKFKDTSSMIPNESFFIRKFSSQSENEPKLNSTILRREEIEEFSKRPTSNSLEYFDHIRDFKTVCRGEPLVIGLCIKQGSQPDISWAVCGPPTPT